LAAPDDTSPDPSLDGIGYADAVAELEEILEQLDGDEIDVDHLAAQVRRASQLIALCRSRLSAARMEVTRIVADLDAASSLVGSDAGTTAEAEAEAEAEADPEIELELEVDGGDDVDLDRELDDDLARDDP
jgi:exodeoxyribonuclease VII small subunit